MTLKKQNYEGSDKRPDKKGSPVQQEAGEAGEITCRCKEVSKKTLPELLRLMIKDLAFWKKPKEHK
ncbi:MAG: hypothetical protein WAV13_00685 [Thermodesulfovibrionales bacterium]